MIFDLLQTPKYTGNHQICSVNAANARVERKPFESPQILTTEQRSVQTEGLRQVVNVGDSLVHGSGEVVGVVQAAQDDAGEVDRLCEIAHQGALESNHIPPERGGQTKSVHLGNRTITFLHIYRQWAQF